MKASAPLLEDVAAIEPISGTGYWREFRGGWRALVAATIGLSAGMSINAYVSSIFGPYLLEAFHWSKAQFALLGALSLVTLVLMPTVGRSTDLFGVRRIASAGIIGSLNFLRQSQIK